MRVYVLIHKGKGRKSFFRNTIAFIKELTFSDNEKVSAGYMFFRKKDAKKYLETLENKEDYTITGITLVQSKKKELPKKNNKTKKKVKIKKKNKS